MESTIIRKLLRGAWLLALLLAVAAPARSAEPDEFFMKPMPEDGLTAETVRAAFPEYFGGGKGSRDRLLDIPSIFSVGKDVLNVGKLYMKVTNNGILGNPFTNISSDPSCQWPGASGIEYMNFIGFAVGAVNPQATDPNAIRRVSYINTEWRPRLDPEDIMRPAYDGIVGGQRFINDDNSPPDQITGFPPIDEDFLDGRDNDGDGRIDEDYAALGQTMRAWVMRDDTPESVNFAAAEKHIPLGLECRGRGWSYSLTQFENFAVVEFEIINVSGHMLDSVVVGFRVDMDCGPVSDPSYFNDDLDVPQHPSGEFLFVPDVSDPRLQSNHSPDLFAAYPSGTPLCPFENIRVNGFSVADDDGDLGRTSGVPSFLLFDHTVDPTGLNGPTRVGFRGFRSFPGGTPYIQGGNPTIDQQRFEMMFSTENIGEDGFINAEPGEEKGDYSAWGYIGPWFRLPPGGTITATVGMLVERGRHDAVSRYRTEYNTFRTRLEQALAENPPNLQFAQNIQQDFLGKYPTVNAAYSAQIARMGIWESREGYPVTDFHGRETPLRQPRGAPIIFGADCHDEGQRPISDLDYTWFDFDCNYCTGVYDYGRGIGLFQKTWNASAPPPNPNTNLAIDYNYPSNTARRFPPAGDGYVEIAWDNLSEVTPDPADTRNFDFRGYKIWKSANWTRPVGSPGPAESEWSLLASFRKFAHYDRNKQPIPNNRFLKLVNGEVVEACPRLFVPQRGDSVDVCLEFGDFYDAQSGAILRPDTTVQCVGYPNCETETACLLGTNTGTTNPCVDIVEKKYPVGRYRYIDREVKNGFLYFYSVTAFDSSKSVSSGFVTELEGRRSGVEAEGVVPQAGVKTGKGVWVVPNPYKGFSNPVDRPSSWDLTPNATDPTGTHIDFLGLPSGEWTIRIYTISGDLVAILRSTDPVNESVRGPITLDDGTQLPGYNTQQDVSNDGQARWNLISRNGQDVVSGIYMFTVESGQGTQRGKFVIIR